MPVKKLIPESIRCRVADLRGRGVYSGYADRYRCIFIHIPKAAGTSVARTLFETGSRHVRYTEYEKANPRKFDQYFKFTFVRNPWDRLYSAYVFLQKGGMNHMDSAWASKHLSAYLDFDSFVKGWINEKNIWSWVHFYPQHYFICDNQFNLKMDFVGRFESLDGDFEFVQRTLGLPKKALPRINVSNNANSCMRHYSEEARQIVAETYAEDIKLFTYSFDNG